MTTKKDQARDLYFHENLTQADIARLLNIHSKTVYRWIKQEHWERIKKAALNAPALITEKAYSLLNKLCTDIDVRDQGRGFPSLDEARTMYMMAGTIQRLKARPTIGDHCESITGFVDHVIRKDMNVGKMLGAEMDEYLLKEAELSQPYDRYELEYHARNYRPAMEDTSDEFEDGSFIIDENAKNIKPEAPLAMESFSQQLSKKELKEKLSKEYINEVMAEYHKNNKTVFPKKPWDEDYNDKDNDYDEEDDDDNIEQKDDTLLETEEDTGTEDADTITIEKKEQIRQALRQLFPNNRWVPADNLQLRDICTNIYRHITEQEWNLLLSKGYTHTQLIQALE